LNPKIERRYIKKISSSLINTLGSSGTLTLKFSLKFHPSIFLNVQGGPPIFFGYNQTDTSPTKLYTATRKY